MSGDMRIDLCKPAKLICIQMLCLYIYIYMIWDGFPLPVTMASGGHCSCVGDHLGIWSWSLYPGSRTSSWIRKVPNLGGPAKVSLRIPWVRRIATTCTMKQMASPEALKSHPGRQLQFRVRLIFVHSKMFLKSFPSIITVSLSWLACYCKLQLKQASRIVFFGSCGSCRYSLVKFYWHEVNITSKAIPGKLSENSPKDGLDLGIYWSWMVSDDIWRLSKAFKKSPSHSWGLGKRINAIFPHVSGTCREWMVAAIGLV